MESTPAGPIRTRLIESRLYYGWYVVIGCFLLSMVTAGTIFSFSVFLGPVLETFDRSYADTSLVFSIQSFVSFGGAAVLGFAVDRYGVRRLLGVAGVLTVAGLLGASQSPSFVGVVFSYGVVAAAGLGITFVVAYSSPPRWFERRRGLATGLAVSGWGVGILVFPAFAEFLIGNFGWQGAYLGLAGVILFAVVVAIVLFADGPHDIGVDISDEFVSPDDHASSGSRTIREQVKATVATARSRLFGLVFVGLLFAFVPSLAVLVYLVEYAESVGISRGIGVLGVSIIGAMNVVAKFVAGGIADVIDVDRTMIGCVGLMFVATVLLVVIPTPRTMLVLAAIFGFGYGGIAALMSPLVANLFGTANLGTLFGTTAIGFAVTGVFVPYFVGYGFDLFGTYSIPFLAAAAVSLLGALAFLAVRMVRPDIGPSTMV